MQKFVFKKNLIQSRSKKQQEKIEKQSKLYSFIKIEETSDHYQKNL